MPASDEPRQVAEAHVARDVMELGQKVAASDPGGTGRLVVGCAVARALPGGSSAAGTPQVVEILLRREATADDGDYAAEPPPRRSSLTRGSTWWSLVLPGQTHARTGMSSRVTARPMTISGRSGRCPLEWPNRRSPRWVPPRRWPGAGGPTARGAGRRRVSGRPTGCYPPQEVAAAGRARPGRPPAGGTAARPFPPPRCAEGRSSPGTAPVVHRPGDRDSGRPAVPYQTAHLL